MILQSYTELMLASWVDNRGISETLVITESSDSPGLGIGRLKFRAMWYSS